VNTKETQDAVFNQTGRVEIPRSFVKTEVDHRAGTVAFKGLHKGDWSANIPGPVMDAANLHVDVHGNLFGMRQTVQVPRESFAPNWRGVNIQVPPELTSGDYRVRLSVSLALPAEDIDGGRVIAAATDIVVVSGPGGLGQTPGNLPLLPVIGSRDFPDLYKLVIDETEGPRLMVNSGIPGVDMKAVVRQPAVQLGVLSSVVREVMVYLAMNQENAPSWGRAWLDLDGVRGRDLPDIEGISITPAFKEARDFAESASQAFIQLTDVVRRFAEATNVQLEEE
jgi:hypothetical protein